MANRKHFIKRFLWEIFQSWALLLGNPVALHESHVQNVV